MGKEACEKILMMVEVANDLHFHDNLGNYSFFKLLCQQCQNSLDGIIDSQMADGCDTLVEKGGPVD